MSEREQAMKLLERVPERKLYYVLAFLRGVTVPEVEEVEPDEWDLKMIDEAQKVNDGETVGIETLAQELGVTL